nr:MAG TPA: hypothetical protein [Caudoviricetes sp.]
MLCFVFLKLNCMQSNVLEHLEHLVAYNRTYKPSNYLA